MFETVWAGDDSFDIDIFVDDVIAEKANGRCWRDIVAWDDFKRLEC